MFVYLGQSSAHTLHPAALSSNATVTDAPSLAAQYPQSRHSKDQCQPLAERWAIALPGGLETGAFAPAPEPRAQVPVQALGAGSPVRVQRLSQQSPGKLHPSLKVMACQG